MAGRYDFAVTQGEDFARSLLWLDEDGNPVGLTGWSAHMSVRAWPIASLLADLSTSGGQIVLGGTAGTIALTIPAATTALFPAGVAKYDLMVTNTTPATSCLLKGNVIVGQAVTLP